MRLFKRYFNSIFNNYTLFTIVVVLFRSKRNIINDVLIYRNETFHIMYFILEIFKLNKVMFHWRPLHVALQSPLMVYIDDIIRV